MFAVLEKRKNPHERNTTIGNQIRAYKAGYEIIQTMIAIGCIQKWKMGIFQGDFK